jgi:hypothetical protein
MSSTNIAAHRNGRCAPQLLRPTSHSPHGGSTEGHHHTTWSTSVDPVGHSIWGWKLRAYYPHVPFGLNRGAGTSASTQYPGWYYPLERYINYVVEQAEWAVKGVGPLEHSMGEIRSFIDSHTDLINSLFGHLGFDPNT